MSFFERPVEIYMERVNSLRRWSVDYIPFTFCAYRALFPKNTNDLIKISEKIKKAAIFVTVVVALGTLVSPFFYIVPFIPFSLDIVRAVYFVATKRKFSTHQETSLKESVINVSKVVLSVLSCIGLGYWMHGHARLIRSIFI